MVLCSLADSRSATQRRHIKGSPFVDFAPNLVITWKTHAETDTAPAGTGVSCGPEKNVRYSIMIKIKLVEIYTVVSDDHMCRSVNHLRFGRRGQTQRYGPCRADGEGVHIELAIN